jgi:hypothetical protein
VGDEDRPTSKILGWGAIAIGLLLLAIGAMIAVSVAGVLFFLVFDDPLNVMGPYGDGVGTAGLNGWAGMWFYGLLTLGVLGLGYWGLERVSNRESRDSLQRDRDRLRDEVFRLYDRNSELAVRVEHLEKMESHYERLAERNAELKSENSELHDQVLDLEIKLDDIEADPRN